MTAATTGWDIDPATWPHTPPLDVYSDLETREDNQFWRAESANAHSLLDEAHGLITELRARIDAAEQLLEQVPHPKHMVTTHRGGCHHDHAPCLAYRARKALSGTSGPGNQGRA